MCLEVSDSLRGRSLHAMLKYEGPAVISLLLAHFSTKNSGYAWARSKCDTSWCVECTLQDWWRTNRTNMLNTDSLCCVCFVHLRGYFQAIGPWCLMELSSPAMSQPPHNDHFGIWWLIWLLRGGLESHEVVKLAMVCYGNEGELYYCCRESVFRRAAQDLSLSQILFATVVSHALDKPTHPAGCFCVLCPGLV